MFHFSALLSSRGNVRLGLLAFSLGLAELEAHTSPRLISPPDFSVEEQP